MARSVTLWSGVSPAVFRGFTVTAEERRRQPGLLRAASARRARCTRRTDVGPNTFTREIANRAAAGTRIGLVDALVSPLSPRKDKVSW